MEQESFDTIMSNGLPVEAQNTESFYVFYLSVIYSPVVWTPRSCC